MKRNDNEKLAEMQERAVKSAEIITKYGDNTIVLFENGTHYEGYNESAEHLNTICKLPITQNGKIAHMVFKRDCDAWIFPKMVREGFQFCILNPKYN